MHKRKFFVNFSLAIPLIAASIVSAQEDYEIPDLSPSKVQIERPSEEASSVITPAPIDESKEYLIPSREQPSSGPGIFRNELRETPENSNANPSEQSEKSDEIPFGAQPLPPQSRGSFNLPDRASNPMQELDPRHLMPELSTQSPATNLKKSESPPALNPSVAAEVPGIEKQSILAPRIPDSVTEGSSQIVAAGYEDQYQQPWVAALIYAEQAKHCKQIGQS